MRVEKDLGLGLWSIVPSHEGLTRETTFYDREDGSRISCRVERVTRVPHVAMSGPRTDEFRAWTLSVLDCWTETEMFDAARRALGAREVDDMVDALVVLFISCPPVALLTASWIELALEFLRHEDADVRDSAVAGAFFGFWRDRGIQEEIETMFQHDPSEAVRRRAAVLREGWRPG